jgi:cytochrome c-type biogenesis protein CcmH
MKRWLLLMTLLVYSQAIFSQESFAKEAKPLSDNPALEVQVNRLSTELRCMVCQNQTLADSSAPLAEDLRTKIRELAAQGKSDQEIIDYLVARYGDFVLYRPPVKSTTLFLWIGPFALLLIGMIGLVILLRRQKKTQEVPLNIDEENAVAELLNRKT